MKKDKIIPKINLSIIFILIYVIFAISILFIIEQYLNLFIAYKIVIKILLFVIIPIIIIGKTNALNLIKIKEKNNRKLTYFLSFGVLSVVILTYIILSSTIDLSQIKSSLQNQVGVTALIFPFIALYIIFINAFIEEFFFRGFLFFHTFKNRILKYSFNSFLFSIYHIGIFITWFAWYNFLLALIGLFIGGLIFSYVNEKNNTIINSYIIHMAADIAIMIIGIKMFYF